MLDPGVRTLVDQYAGNFLDRLTNKIVLGKYDHAVVSDPKIRVIIRHENPRNVCSKDGVLLRIRNPYELNRATELFNEQADQSVIFDVDEHVMA